MIGSSGIVSLRDAIGQSNEAGGSNRIFFNIPGAGIHTITLASPLPALNVPVVIAGNSQPGFVSTPLIEITEPVAGASNGLVVTGGAAGSTIAGLSLYKFKDAIDLEFSNGNTIVSNYIGLDGNGTVRGNTEFGVYANGSSSNIIGTPTGGNVVAGSSSAGIIVRGGTIAANSNLIQANRVGTNAAGTAAAPGNGAGVVVEGYNGNANFNVVSGGNLIAGNADGVDIVGSSATSNTVQGNFIGTDVTGNAALPNATGVIIANGANGNLVGGTTAAARNIISGNSSDGLIVYDVATNHNSIQGNYIGTNAAGTAAVPNSTGGILIEFGTHDNTIGGTAPGAGNLISGNLGYGVRITDAGTNNNGVLGNYIGTNAAGDGAVSNGDGVFINGGAQNNVVGGNAAGAVNLISGNFGVGVRIVEMSTNNNSVRGNYIGTNAAGTVALGNNIGVEVVGGAQTATVGGVAAGSFNLISGNLTAGIHIGGAATSGNNVSGNLIGTATDGTTAIPNGDGIRIDGGAHDNAIGGIVAGSTNVISGNLVTGIVMKDPDTNGNTIQGNTIGLDISGFTARGNIVGVSITGGAQNNLIGGAQAGAGNIISGNSSDGITIVGADTNNNQIEGNFLGTDADGLTAVGNGANGISVFGAAQQNTIGGVNGGQGNTISGNAQNGIAISGQDTSSNSVLANFIGTSANGSQAIPNAQAGISISNSAQGNAIGGATAGNLISGNNGAGVELVGLGTTDNLLAGNLIGLKFNGNALGNGQGVAIRAGASNNTIGGTSIPNEIAFNTGDGVLISSAASDSTNNPIRGNLIHDNGGLGINLGGGTENTAKVTANDPGDGDTGPNNLQNYPVITGFSMVTTQVAVSGTLNSTPNTSFDLDFYVSSNPDPSGYGEGQNYSSSQNVSTDSLGNATFSVPVSISQGQFVTATATDAAGNTSEFSQAVQFLPQASINSATVTEGDTGSTNATFTVSLDHASSQTVTINYATANDTATAGSDYTATAGTLTFAPGTTSKTINVPVLGDTLNEPNETFFVNLSNPANTAITTAQGIGTITDDDPLPSISANDAAAIEGNGGPSSIAFTLTLSAASGKTVSVDYNTSDGTASSLSDYTGTSGTVVFTPGSITKTVLVPIIGDTVNEADETFFLNLTSATNATINRAQATGTIQNDDAVPSLTIGNANVLEGDSGTTNAAFTVTLGVASGQTVKVDYATADGTAKQPGDYTATAGTLTFAPGTTTQTINVPVIGDTLNESNETFTVNLSNAVNTSLTNTQATGTIIDDDATPSLSINDVSVLEGDSGTTNAVFTVSLSTASGQPITVNYATANGSATAPADYTSTAGTLTFNPGVTSRTITVPVIGDTIKENNETFTVGLTQPLNVTISKATGTGTIIDDDGPPSLSVSDVTLNEGNSGTTNAVFSVFLSAASGQTVTVNYTTADGTATAGTDYTSVSGTLTFAPGVMQQTISVPIIGNTLNEPDKTFLVKLANAINAPVVKAIGTGTILNDDAVPVLAINNVILPEGDAGITNATFTVSLSAASSRTVTVNYTTADGTATAGTDYTSVSGTLTFAPGDTSQQIKVPIIGNTTFEPNKTFTVKLAAANGATVGQAVGTGTIVNDDVAPLPPTPTPVATPTPGPSGSPLVTNTLDSGAGSLRDAIRYANLVPGTTIQFNIPTSDTQFAGGVFSIKPLSALPALTAASTVIDGTTQTSFGGDSNAAGPEIVLTGTQAGTHTVGLEIDAAGCAIKGLVINGFSDSGVRITGSAALNNSVQGCYIGTGAAGNVALSNGAAGITIDSGAASNTIGGTATTARNIIAGNASNGVLLDNTNGNTIIGNYIGTDVSGTQMLANLLNGVEIVRGSSNNTIGGSATSGNAGGGSNIIAFNRNDGVRVSETSVGNSIRRNSIYGNSGLGISLISRTDRSDGVTLNDAGDKDTGPNGLQNFPVITTVAPASPSGTELDGTLNSLPGTTYTLDFYSSLSPSATGYGQGQTYLGSTNVSTNSSGNAEFTFTFNGSGQFFSATATNIATGDTSEFDQVPLAISGFSPPSGPVGTLVTINGAGFTTNIDVLFTSKNADGFTDATDVSLISSNQIVARVPADASSGLIAVGTLDGNSLALSASSFIVTTGPPQPPPNDNFANAQTLTGNSGSVAGTNALATQETGEPTHSDAGGESSVWYRWTAPATGSASFDTTGSDFDTVLAVYTGTAVNALTEVASNDNAGIASQSAVRFPTVAGQTYRIAVDGADYGGITAQGKIKLNWTLTVQRPFNDNFVNAQIISGNSGRVTGTNELATKEAGEPNHADNSGGKSVWYSWTAPANGTAIFSTANSDFDTLLASYTGKKTSGNTVRTLNVVANNDDEDALLTSSVTFQAKAGQTYYIAVDGYNYDDGLNGDTGKVVLDWALSTASGTPVQWINPAGGNWGTAANWRPARVPGPTDIAVINLAGTYSVALNIDTTIGGLALGGTNGTQTLILNGHTITLNGASSVNARGVINLSQGTLAANGNFAMGGSFNWTGGHLAGQGVTTITSSGVLNISDPASGTAINKYLAQKSVSNFGTVNWKGAGSIIGGNGTKFRNNNLFYAMSDARFGWDGIGDNPTFINMPGGPNTAPGKFIKTAGNGVDETLAAPATLFDQVVLFNSGSANPNLAGLVQVQKGVLRLQGGGQSYGRFDVPAGAQLEFTSDYLFAKDQSTVTGTGHICVFGNTVSVNTDVHAQAFSVCDGVLTGSSDITATKMFNWEGGVITGRGSTNVVQGALLLIEGTINHSLVGRVFNNAGTAVWTGKSHVEAGGGAVINNTGTFNTQDGATGVTLYHGAGNVPTFNNMGTLNPGGAHAGTTGSSIAHARASAVLATGLFTIYGNYNQASSGILNMDIGGKTPGSSYDQVNINGAAHLSGTLNVTFKLGFVPQVGDSFQVVHYDQRQGTFNIKYQNLPPGTTLQPIYNDSGSNKGLTVQVVKVVAGTFSVGGRVVDSAGAGVAGVQIKRSGASNANSPATTVTGTDGRYTLANVAPGPYTVSASLSGATFSQSSRSVTVSNANITNINFIALFSVSGRVVNSAGAGLAGVTIGRSATLGGAVTQTAPTDAGGNYVLQGAAQGHNFITATLGGYGFLPPAIDVSISDTGGSTPNINFTGFKAPYIIGRVSDGSSTGTGLAGATVKRTDGAGGFVSVTTDASGYYGFESVPPGTYVVSPVLADWLFNFATATVSNTVNVPSLNFSGTRTTTGTTGSARTTRSRVTLSVAVAHATTQSVLLQFTGPLNGAVASEPSHYAVKVNGRTVKVESAAYSASKFSVTLALPDNTLLSGDKVVVVWTDLQDSQGLLVAGQTGTLTAKN